MGGMPWTAMASGTAIAGIAAAGAPGCAAPSGFAAGFCGCAKRVPAAKSEASTISGLSGRSARVRTSGRFWRRIAVGYATVLRQLHVKTLAVLAAAAVEFGPGLNVLSGETGAGKSIVVDSLALLAGVRASAELIRSGAETLTVSGVFDLPGDSSEGLRGLLAEAGVEVEGDEILVRREIARSGRNPVFLNDQPTTLRLLADLAPHLLRIHGQRDELGLVDPELQRVWLDRSGGAEAERPLGEVAAAFAEHQRLAARLERLAGGDRMRRERLDLLRFQAAEIDDARLAAGEELALKSERDVLRHAEAITRALGTAFALLFEEEGSAAERLAKSRSLL